MSLKDEHKSIPQVASSEFDCFEPKMPEEDYSSSYQHSAQDEAQLLPVDEHLLNSLRELHEMIQTLVINGPEHERPTTEQRFYRGSLRQHLL